MEKLLAALVGMALGIGVWFAAGFAFIIAFALVGFSDTAYALLYLGYLPAALIGIILGFILEGKQ